MKTETVSKAIAEFYVKNRQIVNRAMLGGVGLIFCKLLKIPVSINNEGLSFYDEARYRIETSPKNLEIDLPWSNSPEVTAIHYILEGTQRSYSTVNKYESAKRVYNIAKSSNDRFVVTYAMKALSKIEDGLYSTYYKSEIEKLITELAFMNKEEA